MLRAVPRIPGLIPPAVRRNPQCDNRTRLQYCQMFQGWGGEGAVNPPSQGEPRGCEASEKSVVKMTLLKQQRGPPARILPTSYLLKVFVLYVDLRNLVPRRVIFQQNTFAQDQDVPVSDPCQSITRPFNLPSTPSSFLTSPLAHVSSAVETYGRCHLNPAQCPN